MTGKPTYAEVYTTVEISIDHDGFHDVKVIGTFDGATASCMASRCSSNALAGAEQFVRRTIAEGRQNALTCAVTRAKDIVVDVAVQWEALDVDEGPLAEVVVELRQARTNLAEYIADRDQVSGP